MRRWWGKRDQHIVYLYSKPGCHLCEDVRAVLARLERRHGLEVREIDIRSDPALFRRYETAIPVVTVGDQEFQAPISERDLVRSLQALSRE